MILIESETSKVAKATRKTKPRMSLFSTLTFAIHTKGVTLVHNSKGAC